MIDFHSHILPCVDDGSRSVEESVLMLSMLREQGVRRVAATPHFYAGKDSPAEFFKRRDEAMKALTSACPDAVDTVIPGAEVEYYYGVSRMAELMDMRYQGTDILLLEMPVARWSDYTVKELLELSGYGNIKLVLAHVERYMALQSKRVWQSLLDADILMQSNAAFFLNPKTARRALKMLKRGEISLIGSDCHGSEYRAPRLGEAYALIEKKLGKEALDRLQGFGSYLLSSGHRSVKIVNSVK